MDEPKGRPCKMCESVQQKLGHTKARLIHDHFSQSQKTSEMFKKVTLKKQGVKTFCGTLFKM